MNDLNFFEPYLLKENRSAERKPVYTALLIAAIIIIVAVPAGIYGWILLEKQSIDKMTQELSTPEMQANLKRVEEKQAKVNNAVVVLPILEQADAVLGNTDPVNDRVLQDVVDAIPPNVRFDKLKLEGSSCSISGNAKNRSDVAELEYNLRATGEFSDLFLESVEMNSEGYAFSLNLTRKGGAN